MLDCTLALPPFGPAGESSSLHGANESARCDPQTRWTAVTASPTHSAPDPLRSLRPEQTRRRWPVLHTVQCAAPSAQTWRSHHFMWRYGCFDASGWRGAGLMGQRSVHIHTVLYSTVQGKFGPDTRRSAIAAIDAQKLFATALVGGNQQRNGAHCQVIRLCRPVWRSLNRPQCGTG